jgi:hypothetical protein
LAREVLRDVLLEEIKVAEVEEKKRAALKDEVEGGEKSSHQVVFKGVMDKLGKLQLFEFFQHKRSGKWKLWDREEEEQEDLEIFRKAIENVINRKREDFGINVLNDDWLPVGLKKADLLKRLEDIIQEKIDAASADKNEKNDPTDEFPNSPNNNENENQTASSEQGKENEWGK